MSENIFSNFYNKVLSFFQNDKNEGESAKTKATNRLKLVLMQDRSNLDGATMQKMREQLIAVISKYIEIDKDALNLNLESEGDEIALMLNIPVIRARTPEEIDELEKAEEDAKKEDIKAAIEAEIAALSENLDKSEEDNNNEDNSDKETEQEEAEESTETEDKKDKETFTEKEDSNNSNTEEKIEKSKSVNSPEKKENSSEKDKEKQNK